MAGNFSLSRSISLSPIAPRCDKHNGLVYLIQQFYIDKNKKRHAENVFLLKKKY